MLKMMPQTEERKVDTYSDPGKSLCSNLLTEETNGRKWRRIVQAITPFPCPMFCPTFLRF